MSEKISIIIPAKNEGRPLKALLNDIIAQQRGYEIIVVNDGSTDNTSDICTECGVLEVKHLYSKGNGAAIKSGVRHSTGGILLFMDADGQHRPEDIDALLKKMDDGFDMVVGARDRSGQSGILRWLANSFYNKFASWMVGHEVMDLTSGFRCAKADFFKRFIGLLPNGFSYPTTITMAAFRGGYTVGYEPISVVSRVGKSHISLLKDGVKFLLIIFKVGTLYSPLKIFFPMSILVMTIGLIYYLYTFFNFGILSNMSVILFIASILIFVIGLLSEQVALLMHLIVGRDRED